MGSQIVGNIIAAFVLGHLSQVYYVTIMTIIALLSVVAFFALKPPLPHVMSPSFNHSSIAQNLVNTADTHMLSPGPSSPPEQSHSIG